MIFSLFKKYSTPKNYFAGMCLVMAIWVSITLCLEVHLGLPGSRDVWGHRLIGWFLNFMLLRKFYAGTRRYHSSIGLAGHEVTSVVRKP